MPENDVLLARIISFIIAVTIHEFAHAWSAYQLGDTTAARMGRITLNPIAHFDPLGFLGLMLIAMGWPAFGWGKPVPVNPNVLRWHQRGMAITALAGPVSNVIIALVLVVPVRLTNVEPAGFMHTLVAEMVWINLLLAAFNLVPIPPLDGSKILAGVLPNYWYPYFARLEQYGFGILLVLILIDRSVRQPLIAPMYAPTFNLLWTHIVGTAF